MCQIDPDFGQELAIPHCSFQVSLHFWEQLQRWFPLIPPWAGLRDRRIPKRDDRGDMFRLGCIYYHILIYEGKSMIFHDVMFLWYDMFQHIWTYRTAFCVHGTEKISCGSANTMKKISCCVRDTVAKALNVKMLGCRSLTSIPRVGTCWDPVRKGRHFMSQDVITEHFRKAAKQCVQSMNEC
jgi:hypothetical protein